MSASREQFREAVIAALAERSKSSLGRTAIMKLTYFLQELRGVPLGYSYRLYTYGPYDSQVLEDLKIATDKEAVTAQAFQWQGGIGYEIKPGKKAGEITKQAAEGLRNIDADL